MGMFSMAAARKMTASPVFADFTGNADVRSLFVFLRITDYLCRVTQNGFSPSKIVTPIDDYGSFVHYDKDQESSFGMFCREWSVLLPKELRADAKKYGIIVKACRGATEISSETVLDPTYVSIDIKGLDHFAIHVRRGVLSVKNIGLF